MKKTFILLLSAAAAIFFNSCARTVESTPNAENKRFFDAYMELNYPTVEREGLGIYVIENEVGSGAEITKGGYVYADYTVTDFDGNIESYTSEEVARQVGQYDTTNYYGPHFLLTTDGTSHAGLLDAMIGMKVGGRKKVIIPSWLMSYSTFDSEDKYLGVETSYSNTIYDITVKDFTTDINKWEIGKIEDYIVANYGNLNQFRSDTTGFYYRQTKAPVSKDKFPSDTTVFINYTGKLLNGLVFDTTYEKVAKDNGLYVKNKTYGPVSISWGISSEALTMGTSNSNLIEGFSRALFKMKPMESCVAIFYSSLGYSHSGSGQNIPSYSPLIFEIELVAAEE